MQVFYSGCRCGTVGRMINKVKSYAKENNIELEVLNSKYDEDIRFYHLNWLRLNNMNTDRLQPIVVEDNVVRSLAEWTF